MRNGMSVKEVYKRLDQCDRLEEAYDKLWYRHVSMSSSLNKITMRLIRTAGQYAAITKDPSATKEDILEFRGKMSGLNEACQIIEEILKEDLKTASESEEDENGT